jgi:hypothetical protein
MSERRFFEDRDSDMSGPLYAPGFGAFTAKKCPPSASAEAALVTPSEPAKQAEPLSADPPTRRRRRLSFREAVKQAGRPVAAVTDHANGSRTYAFGQSEAASTEEPPRKSLFKARTNPKLKVVL